MNEPIEPLSDRAGDLLGTLVARARTHDVEYDTDAGLARHLARVEALPLVPWWQRALTGWRGGIAIVVIGVAAAAIVGASRDASTQAPVALAGMPAAIVHAAIDRPIAPPIVAAPIEATPVVVAAPRPTPAPTPRVARSDDDALAREAAQIRRARERLERGDAKEALAICNAVAREFPKGTFTPERAGIRVLALHALGRPDAAAAQTYLARWPDGTLAARVRATLDE